MGNWFPFLNLGNYKTTKKNKKPINVVFLGLQNHNRTMVVVGLYTHENQRILYYIQSDGKFC